MPDFRSKLRVPRNRRDPPRGWIAYKYQGAVTGHEDFCRVLTELDICTRHACDISTNKCQAYRSEIGPMNPLQPELVVFDGNRKGFLIPGKPPRFLLPGLAAGI